MTPNWELKQLVFGFLFATLEKATFPPTHPPHHNVLRLQVAVHEACVVNGTQCRNHFAHKKLRHVLHKFCGFCATDKLQVKMSQLVFSQVTNVASLNGFSCKTNPNQIRKVIKKNMVNRTRTHWHETIQDSWQQPKHWWEMVPKRNEKRVRIIMRVILLKR